MPAIGTINFRPRWRWASWIMPLAIFALAECFVRATADRVPTWYGAAERLAERGPVDVVFIGTSRIQSAIRSEAFADTVAVRTQRRLHVLNLGRGYSTTIEHYLGVRNLIRSFPRSLQGVTVFFEAMGGLAWAETWRDPWGYAEQPWLLVDLLRAPDFPDFWRSHGLDVETKLHITARTVLRQSALFNRRERVREQWLTELLPALVELRTPHLVPVQALGDDLRGSGGIRTDAAALRASREQALRIGSQFERSDVPVRGWAGTLPEELVHVVREVGGRVVFLAPPLIELIQRFYRRPVHREDVAIFVKQAQDWGACVIVPTFAYTDDDLPDLWHLRPELAPAFTRSVAEAWLERCPPLWLGKELVGQTRGRPK
jgi:hypothetical protein